MVKGISRQVIVVHSPDPQLFEQAIFILKDKAPREGVSEEALLKEAKALIRYQNGDRKGRMLHSGPIWACGGAGVMGLLWMLCNFL